MTIHFGKQKTKSLEGLLLGARHPLDPISIADKGALIYPIAFWFFIHHFHPRHGLNQSRHIEVFLFVSNTKRNTLGFGCFSHTVIVGFILLGDLSAAGGVTSSLAFPIAQEVKYFVTET